MAGLELVAPSEVPPRGRRRRAPQTREAVLESVRELLKVRRLDDLQVNEIVEQAGISRQTFYAHFDTKYAVVAALIDDVGHGVLEIWRPLFDGHGPIEEDLIRELGASTIQRWRTEGPLFAATIEGWHSDGEIHDVWNSVLTRFAAAFTARVARMRPLGPTDDILLGALITVFERSLYLAVSVPDSPFARSDEDLATVLAQIWIRALRTD